MDRRGFLTGESLPEHDTEGSAFLPPPATPPGPAPLLKRAAVPAGLEAYSGPWNEVQALHLLRRVLFGATEADLKKALSFSLSGCVEALLDTEYRPPGPPVNVSDKDLAVPIGQTWVNAAHEGGIDGTRVRSLQAWWAGLMMGQGFSAREKMTLFWHNHFANEAQVVGDARFMYRQIGLFRQEAFGNFKSLVRSVTLDPAMLRYLNGNSNTKGNPNENYARELLELFTLGKGPEIAPGNYTNYTEDDVKAAARVLTGYQDDRTALTYKFTANRHDATDKTFSAALKNTVILGSTLGLPELDRLIDLLFDREATSLYICRKLYRTFVYSLIDAATEDKVIKPLAQKLRESNFEMRPVLALLFKSAHFHHALNMGCLLKTPLDHTVGLWRTLGLQAPDPAAPLPHYACLRWVQERAAAMQQDLLEPPNVAGWPAYYQEPSLQELWVNSDTLPKRSIYAETLLNSKGQKFDGVTVILSPSDFAKTLPKPYAAQSLVEGLVTRLFPHPLGPSQVNHLKGVLLQGLPEYEWNAEWTSMIQNPGDAAKKTAVDNKLRTLLRNMLLMAEAQIV